MYDLGTAEFEDHVADVIAGLPAEIGTRIKNVAFGVEDGVDPNLLGLYRGVSLDRRGDNYAFQLPDTITIYRLPILARSSSREDVRQRIEVTVKHEIGHYFGIDDARLHELGFG
jgi:predicted Zn-dependent protease with MMP-like domain